MDEVSIITDYIQEEAGLAADIIWGNCVDENLGDKISVTIIATGFQTKDEREKVQSTKKVVSMLVPESEPLVKPVNEFINTVKEGAVTDPYMKVKEDPKQTGLFDLFAASAEEPLVVKHNLVNEETGVENEEAEATEMIYKVTESVMTFEVHEEKQTTSPKPLLIDVQNSLTT